jgi:hypothetical protein
MRYRALDGNFDYTFGQSAQNFLVNTPGCVAQAVYTGLLLFEGEWFLDLTVGMPWYQSVVGNNTSALYDTAIKTQILNTQGVASIVTYSSSLNRVTRTLTVNATILTIYSSIPVPVSATLPGAGYGIGGYGSLPFGS